MATLCELRNKEIVNICDGSCLGCLSDLEIDTKSATICSLIVHGRPRFFGLFGSRESVCIPWNCIKIIGQDTILVETNACSSKRRKNPFWEMLNR